MITEENVAVLQDATREQDINIVALEELPKPSTSKVRLVENVPSLTNLFYEDKTTQTDSFQLPILLNSNERLMHFTGEYNTFIKV